MPVRVTRYSSSSVEFAPNIKDNPAPSPRDCHPTTTCHNTPENNNYSSKFNTSSYEYSVLAVSLVSSTRSTIIPFYLTLRASVYQVHAYSYIVTKYEYSHDM